MQATTRPAWCLSVACGRAGLASTQQIWHRTSLLHPPGHSALGILRLRSMSLHVEHPTVAQASCLCKRQACFQMTCPNMESTCRAVPRTCPELSMSAWQAMVPEPASPASAAAGQSPRSGSKRRREDSRARGRLKWLRAASRASKESPTYKSRAALLYFMSCDPRGGGFLVRCWSKLYVWGKREGSSAQGLNADVQRFVWCAFGGELLRICEMGLLTQDLSLWG